MPCLSVFINEITHNFNLIQGLKTYIIEIINNYCGTNIISNNTGYLIFYIIYHRKNVI